VPAGLTGARLTGRGLARPAPGCHRRPGLARGSRRRTGQADTSAAADQERADSLAPDPCPRCRRPSIRTTGCRRFGCRSPLGRPAPAGSRHTQARTPIPPPAAVLSARPVRQSRLGQGHCGGRCCGQRLRGRPHGQCAGRCRDPRFGCCLVRPGQCAGRCRALWFGSRPGQRASRCLRREPRSRHAVLCATRRRGALARNRDRGLRHPDRGPRHPDRGRRHPDRGRRHPDRGRRHPDRGLPRRCRGQRARCLGRMARTRLQGQTASCRSRSRYGLRCREASVRSRSPARRGRYRRARPGQQPGRADGCAAGLRDRRAGYACA
jgi:hypothetical protein